MRRTNTIGGHFISPAQSQRKRRAICEPLESRCMLSSVILVSDANPGPNSSAFSNLTAAGNLVFFTDDQHSLWRTDGTAPGTVHLQSGDGVVNDPTDVSDLTSVGGKLIFSGKHQFYENIGGIQTGFILDTGDELMSSDGTLGGTGLVKDIDPNDFSGSNPSNITDVNGTALFQAENQLWKSDGTAGGTVLVQDVNPGNITNVAGKLFFTTNGGADLWTSNGTTAGTVFIKSIGGNFLSHGPGDLTAVGNTLFFAASSSNVFPDLWRSDGTPSGTFLVKNIDQIPGGGAMVQDLTAVGRVVFFSANDGVNGQELWKSDGTAAGTTMVKDINPGSEYANPSDLTNVNGTLFFIADNGRNGAQLWKSDGTSAGTVRVSGGLSGISNLVALGGELYFTADDGSHGVELWQSNGTTAGTTIVTDLNPGPSSSSPSWLTPVAHTLYFTANDGVHGKELFRLGDATGGQPVGGGPPPGGGSGGTSEPTATFPAQSSPQWAQTSYSFTVNYADTVALNSATFDNSDVQVTAPNGTTQTATLVSVIATGADTATVTYKINPPVGDFFNNSDNGEYVVTMLPNAVTDSAGNSVPAGTIGTFDTAVIPPNAPELIPLFSASVPPSVIAGAKARVALSVNVVNQGVSPLDPTTVTVSFYLSTHNTYDSSAIPLTSISKPMHLKVGQGKKLSVHLATLPAVPQGTYYILAKVSSADPHVNESKDVAASASAVTIAPPFVDLSNVFVAAPPTLLAGKKASVSVLLENLGNSPFAGPVTIALTASVDQTPDPGDFTLMTLSKSASIKPRKTKLVKLTFTVPSSLPHGSYFLIATAAAGGIADANPANNVAIRQQPLTA